MFKSVYAVIDHVDVIDDLTAKLTFKTPQLAWYIPFSGSFYGVVVPKHVLEGGPEKHDAFTKNPIGTGPYIVDSFTPGDQVVYAANPNFRDPNLPFFAKVNLKGGGEATDAARAVLQTGDWDFAWNVQVEPKLLKQMQDRGGKGTVQTTSPVSLSACLSTSAIRTKRSTASVRKSTRRTRSGPIRKSARRSRWRPTATRSPTSSILAAISNRPRPIF